MRSLMRTYPLKVRVQHEAKLRVRVLEDQPLDLFLQAGATVKHSREAPGLHVGKQKPIYQVL